MGLNFEYVLFIPMASGLPWCYHLSRGVSCLFSFDLIQFEVYNLNGSSILLDHYILSRWLQCEYFPIRK
jgi:hypothetical protein